MFKGLFPGSAHAVYPILTDSTESTPVLPLSGTAWTLHRVRDNALSMCGLRVTSLKCLMDLRVLPCVYHIVSICERRDNPTEKQINQSVHTLVNILIEKKWHGTKQHFLD